MAKEVQKGSCFAIKLFWTAKGTSSVKKIGFSLINVLPMYGSTSIFVRQKARL